MSGVFDDCPRLAEFLNHQPVAVVSLPINEDGVLHSATLGYWHTTDPLTFFFVTSKNSEKCQLLNVKKELPATCVVGTYMGTDFTLQMRGTLRILDQSQYQKEIDSFCEKRGKSRDYIIKPDSVLLGFTPNWARYTDYSQGWDHHMLQLNSQANDE